MLSAKLGGKRRVIAFLRGLHDKRDGFGVSLRAKAVLLTQDIAEMLNAKLHVGGDFGARSLSRPAAPDVFGALRRLATSHTVVEPRTVTAIGGSLNLALDQAFVGKLAELNVEVHNFEGASLISATPQIWSFPLLRGAVSPLLTTGLVGSETGLRLQQDEFAAVMTLAAITDILESDSLFAAVSVHRPAGEPSLYGMFPIASLSRSGALASTNPATRAISYTGAPVSLSAQLADALNDAFAKPKGKADVFKAGEPLGDFGFDVRTQ